MRKFRLLPLFPKEIEYVLFQINASATLLICLQSSLLLMSQTPEVATPVSKQLRKFPIGAAIQFHMVDGRSLKGKLVSSSAANCELQESGQDNAETIECGEVKAVSQINASPRKKRTWALAVTVVGALAAARFGAAHAGSFIE
jgi:hypothetical protein